MFVHKSQLGHLLTPDQYWSERQHAVEVERLFLPAWHVVATTADLPRPGDFLTTELLGRPLLVRNVDGQVHAYLNVCAHRHCLLTHRRRGHDPRFRCQYHGWEYDGDGRTRKIPDAGCFRPFDRANARLRRYRTETCGQLVFVSLAADGPGLAEFLGPYHDQAREGATAPYRLCWARRYDHACNWKVPIENSLETYHVPCLHPKTFRDAPAEELCEHELHEGYTAFQTPAPDTWPTRFMRWCTRRLGRTPGGVYSTHHIHPHLTFATLDVFHVVQQFLPTSPATCRHHVYLYSLHGTSRWNPWTRLLARLLRAGVKSATRRIIFEDIRLYPDAQRGLCASVHPGVLGTREERVYAFQDWVVRSCADPPAAAPAPQAVPPDTPGGAAAG
jgi:phenylpropionate dioxygenase-like ring-hydroxylating dioxygenase large terminal subunit